MFDPAKIIIYEDGELKTLLDLHPELNGFNKAITKNGILHVTVGDITYTVTYALNKFNV